MLLLLLLLLLLFPLLSLRPCSFHWDLPQVLQDKYQGFLDPRIQEDYLYYADTVFAQLGDLVDHWMTFNEVISICELGYQKDVFAPAVSGGGGGPHSMPVAVGVGPGAVAGAVTRAGAVW